MPIYVYQCADCEAQTEKRQGFADAPLTTCETCGGSIRRLLQPVGIIFKGSGFYSTDYRPGTNGNGKKDGADGEAKATSGESSSTASSESKGGESKSSESKNGSGEKASSTAPAAAAGTSAA